MLGALHWQLVVCFGLALAAGCGLSASAPVRGMSFSPRGVINQLITSQRKMHTRSTSPATVGLRDRRVARPCFGELSV